MTYTSRRPARSHEGVDTGLATEDLVGMFHEMGLDTGQDLPAVVEAPRRAQTVLGRTLTSHSLVTGQIDWHLQSA